MKQELWLRSAFVGIVAATLFMTVYFRRKARKSGEVIPRSREGGLYTSLRFLLAAPLYLSLIAYMVNPEWTAWSSVSVPVWLRWSAGAIGVGMLPILYWVMRSLGKNISETVLTKRDHVLVRHGPYRWVRHPLYSVSTMLLVSLGILAANWFMIGMAVLIVTVIALIVIPREETELMKKFGAEYQEYMKRTGMLAPHFAAASLRRVSD